VARYDLGLSWDEFEECTPAMFLALCKRRNVRIRYERYAHGQTAAAVYNTNRSSDDQPVIQAMDFARTQEQVEAKERKLAVLQFITNSIRGVPKDAPRRKFLEVRRNVIKKLADQGCVNAEQLFDEKWPSLKPTKDEQ